MRIASVGLLSLVIGIVSGCDDGGGGGDASVQDGGGVVDCASAADGTECGAPGWVCVSGACRAGGCGDLVVGPGEDCDDGNEIAFDGCTACRFDCITNTVCDDGDPCSGEERCDIDTHVCVAGVNEPEGTTCVTDDEPDGVCREMGSSATRCIAAGCGNGVTDGTDQCDDGANGNDDDGCRDDCRYSCSDADDCDDGDVCDGDETCDTSTHVCAAGTPLDCDDGDDCTAEACDAVDGCASTLIDADGDGHPPLSAGACGTDCNDTNDSVRPGAAEACDGVDNNCDGTIDETAPFWYVDCDRDGFALDTDGALQSCTMPIGAPSVCTGPGTWTSLEPTDGATSDCNDQRLEARPGATEPCNRFDDDCDGFVDEDLLLFDRRPPPGSGMTVRIDAGAGPLVHHATRRRLAFIELIPGDGGFGGGSNDELHLIQFTEDGAELSDTLVQSNADSVNEWDLIVLDGDYLLVEVRARQLQLRRIDGSTGGTTLLGSIDLGFTGPTPSRFRAARLGSDEIGLVYGDGTRIGATRFAVSTGAEVSGARIDDFSMRTVGFHGLFEVLDTRDGLAVVWQRRNSTPTTYDRLFRTLTPAGPGTRVVLGPYQTSFGLTYDAAEDQVIVVELGTLLSGNRPVTFQTVDCATATASGITNLGDTYNTSVVPTAWAGEPGQFGIITRPNDGDPRFRLRRIRSSDGAPVPSEIRVDLDFEDGMLGAAVGGPRFLLTANPTGSLEMGHIVCAP